MFGQVGGQARRSIAALDATTGNATPWYPQPTAWGSPTEVKALALVEGSLYVGGAFGSIGGQPRICLASVDTSTGLATNWDPGTDGLVWSLAAYGGTVYAGGGFTRAGGLPTSGLAAFSTEQPVIPEAPVTRLAISRVAPNPVYSVASLRIALPASGRVNLDVFDLQGRRVATLLHDDARAAGVQEIPIRTEGWPGGIYFCRLESAGQFATSKMLLIK
jgi:hypothetical protein